jgi:hypothetical protein
MNVQCLVLCVTVLFTSCDVAADGPASSEEARKRLLQLSEQARKFPEAEYTIQTWNEMRFALHDARGMVNR